MKGKQTEHLSFEGHAVVACGALRRELNYLRADGFLDADTIRYTGPGLHARPEELDRQLTRQLDRAGESCPKVIVVYGSKCYLDPNDPTRTIDAITQPAGAARVSADNCIDMLSDSEQRDRFSAGESVLWLSPGWMENWKRIYQDYLGWDAADANMNFPGYYSKAVLLDPEPLGLFEEWSVRDPARILEFSDWTRLPVESMPVTLDRLKGLLRQCVARGERLGKD